jgi:glycosyltransferase involved in cell wall biosynthesis
MKVMQISPYFPPHLGGVEYHVKGLSDGLLKRGYNVSVASSCGKGNFEFTRIPSINLYYAPFPLRLPRIEADVFHSHVPSPIFAFFFRKSAPHVVTCTMTSKFLERSAALAAKAIRQRLSG